VSERRVEVDENIPIGSRILNYRNPGTIHIHASFVSRNCRLPPQHRVHNLHLPSSPFPSFRIDIIYSVSEGEIEKKKKRQNSNNEE